MRTGKTRSVIRVAATVIALGTIIGGAAACGGSDSGGSNKNSTVTLRFEWWGNADRAKITQQVVDLYQQKHPNIKIETSFAEFNAYFQKLATEVAGGGAPDIMQMDYRYVREYSDRNALAEFTGAAKVNTSALNASLVSGGKINGKLYAIPLGQNTQEFTYDPAAWQAAGATAPKAGWTWADLTTALQKVADASSKKVAGATDYGPIEDWFEVWLRQHGKSLYTDKGVQGYTADDVATWWTQTDALRKSGAVTAADLTSKVDGSQANDPMVKKLATSGFGYDSGFTAQTFQIYGRDLALAPFPSDSPSILGQYAKPAMQVAVFKRSKHTKEAAEFIDFFINNAEAGKLQAMSRGMPVNKSTRETVGTTLTGPPLVAYQYEQTVMPSLKDAPPPPPKGASAVKTSFQRVYDDVMFGRATPKEAADRFMKESKQALTS